MPEDEPQFGTLWEHIANAYKSGKGILNYGESLEIEGGDERDGTFPEGQRVYLNSPIPVPVFESSDRNFPTFNLGIPDQLRFEEFKKDLGQRIAKGEVPALIVIRLPNDHMTRARPDDGYPYRASYVADNDLALGKIVAWLSTTPIWRDSALFVTEDDAQAGVDHVDAHRSILGIASPWLKPGSVSHSHTDFGSITRTIDELLGLGPQQSRRRPRRRPHRNLRHPAPPGTLRRRPCRSPPLHPGKTPKSPSPKPSAKPPSSSTWTTPRRSAST